MNDLCITVRALKRADYTKRCLDSLEKNTDLGCDFYFFQDGAVNKFSGFRYATDNEIGKSLKVFRQSKLPNKIIKHSIKNVGGGIAKNIMFNDLFPKYKYVMMLDNDLVFNKYYIKTIKTLFKQFEGSNAGMLQTSYRHLTNTPIETKKFAKENENKVAWGFSHRWEQGFWRSSWKRIKPYFKPFADLTSSVDFMLVIKGGVEPIRKRIIDIYGKLGDDNALEVSAIKAGYKGLHTLALRHKTIGKEGQYTFHSWRWEAENFNKVKVWDIGKGEKYVIS